MNIARKTNQDKLKKYVEMVGVNKGGSPGSPHTFLHSCARMYIMQGGDIFSLQQY